MFGASIGRGATRIINAMVRWLAYGGVHPNILTVIGVMISIACGLLFGLGHFFWAGIVLIVANLFGYARWCGREGNRECSPSFGGFLDSSLDRVSDIR